MKKIVLSIIFMLITSTVVGVNVMLDKTAKEQQYEQLKQEAKIESVDEKIDTEDIAVKEEKNKKKLLKNQVKLKNMKTKKLYRNQQRNLVLRLVMFQSKKLLKIKKIVVVRILHLYHSNQHKVQHKTNKQILTHKIIILNKKQMYQHHFMIQ